MRRMEGSELANTVRLSGHIFAGRYLGGVDDPALALGQACGRQDLLDHRILASAVLLNAAGSGANGELDRAVAVAQLGIVPQRVSKPDVIS